MSDKDLYKKRIRETYHAIYDDRYNFHPTIMEYERKKILKNIQEMQLEISDLKKMNVFNIGTGLESIIFHTLGAKKIYHYDISEIQVKNLNQLKKTDPKFIGKKMRRNEPCYCGSGKKYKHCCGAL